MLRSTRWTHTAVLSSSILNDLWQDLHFSRALALQWKVREGNNPAAGLQSAPLHKEEDEEHQQNPSTGLSRQHVCVLLHEREQNDHWSPVLLETGADSCWVNMWLISESGDAVQKVCCLLSKLTEVGSSRILLFPPKSLMWLWIPSTAD